MKKMELLYQGKAKKIYRTDCPLTYWVTYKDDATAFNAKKRGTIEDKGIVNNKVSAHFFSLLEAEGIPTHFLELINDREMLVRACEIIMVEVVVRNIAAGSLSQRLGIPEGTPFPFPVVEYCYKSDELNDPLINDDHIQVMGLASKAEMEEIRRFSLRINDILQKEVDKAQLTLVDFKLEFGRYQGHTILADEISPDTCRFWDKDTGEKLDKDRFRRDLGGVKEAYQEALLRLTGGKK